jgi:hypothetical protein
MPSGTTIKMFAARIHKSNAKDVLEDTDDNIAYLKCRLVAMACATTANVADVLDEVVRGVNEIVEELMEESFRNVCADNIISFPDECDDENEVVG